MYRLFLLNMGRMYMNLINPAYGFGFCFLKKPYNWKIITDKNNVNHKTKNFKFIIKCELMIDLHVWHVVNTFNTCLNANYFGSIFVIFKWHHFGRWRQDRNVSELPSLFSNFYMLYTAKLCMTVSTTHLNSACQQYRVLYIVGFIV